MSLDLDLDRATFEDSSLEEDFSKKKASEPSNVIAFPKAPVQVVSEEDLAAIQDMIVENPKHKPFLSLDKAITAVQIGTHVPVFLLKAWLALGIILPYRITKSTIYFTCGMTKAMIQNIFDKEDRW